MWDISDVKKYMRLHTENPRQYVNLELEYERCGNLIAYINGNQIPFTIKRYNENREITLLTNFIEMWTGQKVNHAVDCDLENFKAILNKYKIRLKSIETFRGRIINLKLQII
jgi:hypothetical protein